MVIFGSPSKGAVFPSDRRRSRLLQTRYHFVVGYIINFLLVYIVLGILLYLIITFSSNIFYFLSAGHELYMKVVEDNRFFELHSRYLPRSTRAIGEQEFTTIVGIEYEMQSSVRICCLTVNLIPFVNIVLRTFDVILSSACSHGSYLGSLDWRIFHSQVLRRRER